MEVQTSPFTFYWHHHGGEVGSHSLPPDEGASSNSWMASLKSGGWGVQGEVPHHHRMGVEIQALYLASSNTAWARRVASTSLLPPVRWGSLGPLPQLPNLFSKVRVWNDFFPGILLKWGIYYQKFSVLLGCASSGLLATENRLFLGLCLLPLPLLCCGASPATTMTYRRQKENPENSLSRHSLNPRVLNQSTLLSLTFRDFLCLFYM